MRELLTNAQGKVQAASLTSEIQKYWTQLCEEIEVFDAPTSYSPTLSLLSFINGTYHQIKDKLVIFSPRTLTPVAVGSGKFGYELSAGSCALIYDFAYQAWTVRTFADPDNIPGSATTQIISAYYHPRSNKLFFGSNNNAQEACLSLWGNTGAYQDEYNVSGNADDIEPRLISAPLPVAFNRQMKSVRLTHAGHSSSKTSTTVSLIGDLGANNSSSTSFTFSVSGASRDHYNVGLEADYLQIDLNTATDENADQAYQIASIATLLEEGGVVG